VGEIYDLDTRTYLLWMWIRFPSMRPTYFPVFGVVCFVVYVLWFAR
jgi:hypothetical protein